MKSRKRIKNVAATRARRIKKRAPRTKREDVPRTLNVDALERLYAQGLIDRQVALALGVSERTLNRYKLAPGVMSVVEAGREKAHKKIIHSLYQRACGYTYAEVTVEPVLATRQVAGEKQTVMVSRELAVTKTVIKHQPADMAAAEFFLTNRDPDNWKRKVDVTSGGEKLEPPTMLLPLFGGRTLRAGHDGK